MSRVEYEVRISQIDSIIHNLLYMLFISRTKFRLVYGPWFEHNIICWLIIFYEAETRVLTEEYDLRAKVLLEIFTGKLWVQLY
jgi:hypothetical protein